MTPHSVFSPDFKVQSIVYIDKNCQAIIFFINLGLDLGGDMQQELHISLARCWRCSQYNMSGIL